MAMAAGRHSERCKLCKQRILQLLVRVYGQVEERHSLNLPAELDGYRKTRFHSALTTIHRRLQAYRGFREFVRARNLPAVDYYVPDPGFIVEFDESQHFTKPREISFRSYPEEMRLGFDKATWLARCERLNRHDDDPPYRDEQRAWYDTLRDFGAVLRGVPLVRILPDEQRWCELSVDRPEDVEAFRQLMEAKRALWQGHRAVTRTGLAVGLAFPELGEHTLHHFVELLRRSQTRLDLLAFPETFELMRPAGALPGRLSDHPGYAGVRNRYLCVARGFGIGVIVGLAIQSRRDTSVSGENSDQYCMFVSPGGQTTCYHKHSTSLYNAFFDDDWSVERNLPVVQVGNVKIGLSLCHDSYISLIPRALRRKGAEIRINVSYQNLRPHIWQPVLEARATENEMLAVCTLHRNSTRSNVQKEPYAFSGAGKIRLRDPTDGRYLADIADDDRTGRIFWFDTSEHEVEPLEPPRPSSVSPGPCRVKVRLSRTGAPELESDAGKFAPKELDLHSFIWSPEKLWHLALADPNRIALFVVWVPGAQAWDEQKALVNKVVRARVVEFSTLFLFVDRATGAPRMAAYRSSSYKDTKIVFPADFPVEIDRRFLYGMPSLYEISLSDPRKTDDSMYFQRVQQLIDFLRGAG